jgi:hypothetical protein
MSGADGYDSPDTVSGAQCQGGLCQRGYPLASPIYIPKLPYSKNGVAFSLYFIGIIIIAVIIPAPYKRVAH